MRTIHRLGWLALGTIALAPLACGGSKSEAQSPAPGPSAGASGAYGSYAPPAGSSAAPPPYGAPAASGAPTMAPQPTASAPPAASSAAPAPAPTTAITTALLAPLAAKYAPGMQPEGEAFITTLNIGGHAQVAVTMTGGKCYTIVAASPPGVGVTDLGLRLLAPPFYTVSAGEGGMHKNEAVIGKSPKPTCPIVPMPVAYKVDVSAEKGQGPVVVQVYSKVK